MTNSSHLLRAPAGWVLGLTLLASPVQATIASAPPAMEHAFARARFALAAQDTAAAVDALTRVLATEGPETIRTRAIVLLQLLEDLRSPLPGSASAESRAWQIALSGGALDADPAALGRASSVRLLAAARALDRLDPRAARAWLDGAEPRREFEVLHHHLQARLAELEGTDARAHWNAVATAKPQRADLELIAAAALRLAQHAIEAGEDPTPWLQRVPATSTLAPRAALVTLILELPSRSAADAAAGLEQWLVAHPDHPAADDARAWRVSLALDHADFASARRHALVRAEHLLDTRDALARSLEDSTRLRQRSADLWDAPLAAALRVDAGPWEAARAELTERLASTEQEWPSVESALQLRPAEPSAWDPPLLDLTASDRALDAALADSLRRAERVLARARAAQEALQDELARRLAYHARGAAGLEDVSDSLRATLLELAQLRTRGPDLLEDLRAVEDTLLARVERHSRAAATRAQDHAEAARGLHWLYAEGPMARRDPAPHPEVPVPGDLLQAEAEFADSLHTALDSLRVNARELVRRSFSEVFARRITQGTAATAAWAERLLARDERLLAALDSTTAVLALDPALARAEATIVAARASVEDAQARRAAHRLQATERALARAIETLDARNEGLLYTLAVATTELAVNPQDPAPLADASSEARALWARLLALDPDPRVRSDARYRWAELELHVAQAEFQDRMGEWLAAGRTDARALAPLLDIEAALELFRTLLAEDPQFARRDLVLFQLGMLHADRGDPEAESYLADLVENHPDSEVLQEAQLRRGELAFDAADHRRAIGHLRAAASGDDAQVSAIALYKLGWSANATGEVPLAIDAFLRLCDLYADPARAPQRIDLADEARALLLRSIARDGGADAFARTFDAAGERDFAADLLADLSGLLAGHALEDQAAAADRLFLQRYPLHAGALDAAGRLVLSAERAGGLAAGDAARLDVIDHFVRDGAWAEAQPADSLRTQGDAFAREALLAVAVRRHQRARETSAPTDHRSALALYDRLLAGWPEHADAPRWNLAAGECAGESGDFAAALDRFGRAAATSGEVAAEAAWQRVAIADRWYRASIDSESRPGAAAGADSLARQLLRIGDAHPPEDPKRAADLQWRLAQVALAHGWDEEIATRFEAFAQAYPADPRGLQARTLHAEALYRQHAYDRAARGFETAMRAATQAGADSLANTLRPWIAHSEDLHANAVAADSTRGPAEAAPLWRALVERWPDFDEADRALYRAGLGFEQGGAHAAAVEAWETLLTTHPQSGFAADAHRNLARHHEDQGDLAAAAAAIERYAAAFPQADDAGDALLHAVGLLERAGDGAGRARTLDVYLQQHPEDLATRRWVLEERANVELDAGREGEAVRALLEFAQQHPEQASNALLARIELRRADALVDAYTSIALTQPLTASLERKRDSLTTVLDAYRKVAERGVTPFAQAAAYEIGSALVHMGEALLASERPVGLGGDDLAAYDEVLEEQAWTFTERGEEAWRELLRLHREVEDPSLQPWIASTRAALFPRTAQRFLHRPSFEYPVLGGTSSGR